MGDISTIATNAKTREIVKRHSFTLKKNYGQNFLVDGHVLNKIITASEITKEDLIIEIGPGIGGLTQPLAEHAGKVIAVEIDQSLIPILHETLEQYQNVEIINGDILKIDFGELISNQSYDKIKVVANLPYYITTPIIMDLLEKKYPLDTITVMVQKEVALRMAASPGSKDYGALSLAVQYYAQPYLVANVPSNCFIPRPNVDSAVVRLKVYSTPVVAVTNEALLFQIIKAAFSMRRKTLVNCLFALDTLSFTKDEIKEILINCGFNENIRGETLNLSEVSKLTNFIDKLI